MAKKRTRSNRQTREAQGPINPYKVTDENIYQEELAGLEWESPVFAVPALDALLDGMEWEAEQVLEICRL